MKKIFTSLLLLLGLCATAQVKIGDNPTTVGASSLLELESTNKALVVPRVANTAAITNPVNGMIVYDISSQCFKGYQNGEWSGCGMTQSATASILAQIGAEADSPDIVPSQVSATQLYSLGVTSVVPAYEGAYQEYIDANPGLFSNPATMAEVQAMIMAVNSQVTDILTQIGNEGDNPDTIVSVVTIDQLQDLGITGVTPGNEIAYQEYIDSHPDAFGNPASIAEIQSLVTTVNNTVTSVLAQIGTEGDNPDTVNSVVTVTQLQSIGITGVTPDNEVAYQEYIDSHPDSFSNPATLSEIQSMVNSVNNTVTSVLAQIGTEGDNPDTVNSVVTATQLQSIGITGVTPANEVAYQDYIDSHPDSFSNPATLSEIQAMVTSVNNTVSSVLAQIGTEGDNPDTVNSVVTATQLQSIGITGVTPANEVAYQDYIDANPNAFSSPATTSEVQAMVTAVNASANTSGGTGTVSAYVCNTASAGTLTAGTAASGVTQTITATVTTVGTYSISATANGITFSGSGTFAGTGAQNIILTASGTPAAVGSHSFALSTTPGCSFSRSTVDVTSGGDSVVSSWSCGGAMTGAAAQGVAVSGLTKVITANVTTVGTYSISATANGITFSGSGTFAGTGNQNVTLTATGTPTAAGTHSFSLSSTPGCSFNLTTYTLTPVSYVVASRATSTQSLSSGTVLVFNSNKGGTIPMNTSTGEFTLTGGKTYRLTFHAQLNNYVGSNPTLYIEWVDAAGNALIPNAGASCEPATMGFAQSDMAASDIIYTPASTQVVKLKVNWSTSGASATMQYDESSVLIQELGSKKSAGTMSTVDYIMATKPTDQTSVGTGSDIIMNTNSGSNNIALNTSTGVFTLTAGKTYRLYFQGRIYGYSSGGAGEVNIQWVNASNVALAANSGAQNLSCTNTGWPANSVYSTEIIYTPATNENVKLRCTYGVGTGILQGGVAIIQELEVNSSLDTISHNFSYNSGGLTGLAAAGANVKMTTTASGTIPLDATNGYYTLTAGKTYRLTFAGTFYNTTSGSTGFRLAYWADYGTNTDLVSGLRGTFVPLTYTTAVGNNPITEVIYTPVSNQTVIVRSAGLGTSDMQNIMTDRVIIQELGVSSN